MDFFFRFQFTLKFVMSRITKASPNRSRDELDRRMEAFGRAFNLFSILVDEDLLNDDSEIIQPSVADDLEERNDEASESIHLENAEATSESNVAVDQESAEEDTDSGSSDVFVDEFSGDEDSDSGANEERGLTPDRIERFSTFNADQKSVDDGCAICIDGVEINKLMIRLECNHLYCNECISKWFENNTSCPVCRKEYHN